MKTPKPSASRDTTVRVTKYTEVDEGRYHGGTHVVPSEVARELVKRGNATILQSDKPKGRKSSTNETGEVEAEGES